MREALPQLQAQWCLQADGLLAAVQELESTDAMLRLQSSASRLRLKLDMRNMEHGGNAGSQWQEAVKAVVNTVVASDASGMSAGHDKRSRRHQCSPVCLADIQSIPDLRIKTRKAFMYVSPMLDVHCGVACSVLLMILRSRGHHKLCVETALKSFQSNMVQ